MSNSVDRVMGKDNKYEAVFTDKTDNSQMDQSDFLKLMVAQMQNQDFTNPMDNSQMVNQMVQFSNMQMMQEMASYSKTNYAMSLVGKTVTATRFTVAGALDTTTGVVDKVSFVDNEYVFYIGDKKYTMNQIMEVTSGKKTEVPDTKPEEKPGETPDTKPDETPDTKPEEKPGETPDTKPDEEEDADKE